MKAQPVLTHLAELRSRVIKSCISIVLLGLLSYTFFDAIFLLLQQPFLGLETILSKSFFVKNVVEGVTLKLKFSFLFGVIFSIPIITYQVIRFVFPGLLKKEKRVILISLFCSSILSSISFFYSYFIVLPIVIVFLTSHHFIPTSVGILLNYSESIFFVFNFICMLICLFQFPILMIACVYLKIVSFKRIIDSVRYVIVCIFALSAIITPPDILSQLLISVPLLLLFFISLCIIKMTKIGEGNV